MARRDRAILPIESPGGGWALTPESMGLSRQYHRLGELLTHEQAELLVRLLQDVQSVTGYGEVVLVLSEGRLVQIKATFSHRTRHATKNPETLR